jgi:hypothetical protein
MILLDAGRVALLPLIGLTRIDVPEQILPIVVQKPKEVENKELQGSLLVSLLALISDGELVNMIEKLLEEELLVDTPFLRKIREEGRIQGALAVRHQSILDVLALRFDPSASTFQQIEQVFTSIQSEAGLERIFAAAIRSATLAEFQAALPQVQPA